MSSNKDYYFKYELEGECSHKVTGTSKDDIPINTIIEKICPFCDDGEYITFKIIEKERYLKEKIFKKLCNDLFPKYIRVNGIVYSLYAGQIMTHFTCRIFYYNAHLNKTLIETFFSKDPHESIEDFKKKLNEISYKRVSLEEFLNSTYPHNKEKIDE